MSTLAAVFMPWQIREPGLDIERLYKPLRFKRGSGGNGSIAIPCESPQPLQSLISEERAQSLRLLLKEQDADSLLVPFSVACPP